MLTQSEKGKQPAFFTLLHPLDAVLLFDSTAPPLSTLPTYLTSDISWPHLA